MCRMNCDYCKNKYSAYIDNELSREEHLFMAEHLQKCTSCAREVETLQHISALLVGLPEETPSQVFVNMTVSKAAVMRRRSRNRLILQTILLFIRNAITLVLYPSGYGTSGAGSLSSYGYLRAFDDSPPGSFAKVYLTVIQGGRD